MYDVLDICRYTINYSNNKAQGNGVYVYMIILKKVIAKEDLENIGADAFFNDMFMVKAVVDVDQELIAVNADMMMEKQNMTR